MRRTPARRRTAELSSRSWRRRRHRRQLATELANRLGLPKSPAYKRTAPWPCRAGRQVLGNDWQPSGGIIREAIAQNWDQATFLQHIRGLPGYQKGPEFRTNLAQNTNAFQNVYAQIDRRPDHPADAAGEDTGRRHPGSDHAGAQQQPA